MANLKLRHIPTRFFSHCLKQRFLWNLFWYVIVKKSHLIGKGLSQINHEGLHIFKQLTAFIFRLSFYYCCTGPTWPFLTSSCNAIFPITQFPSLIKKLNIHMATKKEVEGSSQWKRKKACSMQPSMRAL